MKYGIKNQFVIDDLCDLEKLGQGHWCNAWSEHLIEYINGLNWKSIGPIVKKCNTKNQFAIDDICDLEK